MMKTIKRDKETNNKTDNTTIIWQYVTNSNLTEMQQQMQDFIKKTTTRLILSDDLWQGPIAYCPALPCRALAALFPGTT